MRASRTHLAGGAALLLTVAAAWALLRERPAAAYAGMPDEQRAYWTWVTSLNRTPEGALDDGFRLLAERPGLRRLYLRLADACVAKGVAADCRARFVAAHPPADARLYREAALAVLAPDTAAAHAAWARVAAAPALDAPLARRVADYAGAHGWGPEAAARFAADTTRVGGLFGVALGALRANDWATAERLLTSVLRRAPGEPEAYRELGRLYYLTGRTDRQEAVLRAGIAAAKDRHDLEAALVLRGNLGLALLGQDTGLPQAEALFHEALATSRLLGDPARVAVNQYRLGSVRLRQHRYTDALAYVDSVLALDTTWAPAGRAEALALRGTAEWALFRFSDATATLDRAREEAQAKGAAPVELQAATSLVQLRTRTGRYEEARTLGLAALARAREVGMVDAEIALRLVLGDVERYTGNLEPARLQYAEGVAKAEATGNSARLAELYQRLGEVMLELRDPTAARAFFERLVRVGTDAERTLEGLGRVYHQFGNDAQALAYYDRGLQSVAPEHVGQRASLLVNKAWALAYLGRYGEAGQAVQAGLRLTEGAFPRERYELAAAAASIALDRQDFAGALRWCDAAEAAGRRVGQPTLQWHLQHARALALWRLDRPAEAEAAFRAALETIEALRDNLYTRTQRASFVQDKTVVYKNFVAFLRAQRRDEEAFRFVERARSRSLADLLFATQQGRAPAATAEGRLLEAQRRRSALAEALGDVEAEDEGGGVRAGELRREFLRADSAYALALAALPRTQLYTALARPLDAAAVRRVLRPGEALVMFSLGAESRAVSGRVPSLAYVFTATGQRVVTLDVDPVELADQVRFFRESIGEGGRPGQGWEAAAKRLYADLLAPVVAGLPAEVRHLHLVPEGTLHYLPFAALQDPRGRFLVERFTLSTAPSASVLALARQRGSETAGRWRRVVAVADPNGTLPGTRREVEALRAMTAIKVDALVGEQATQANLELLAPDADVLHLATHGTFVSRAPGASSLELRGGTLSVGEIERLRLDRPYLVTLSACETALGSGFNSDVPPGDEWVGLNQAFLAAGAPSVLASLWPIDDRASSQFMTDFYTDLLDARGKAAALAAAQRSFLGTRYRHPFFWAAFTLTGDPV